MPFLPYAVVSPLPVDLSITMHHRPTLFVYDHKQSVYFTPQVLLQGKFNYKAMLEGSLLSREEAKAAKTQLRKTNEKVITEFAASVLEGNVEAKSVRPCIHAERLRSSSNGKTCFHCFCCADIKLELPAALCFLFRCFNKHGGCIW